MAFMNYIQLKTSITEQFLKKNKFEINVTKDFFEQCKQWIQSLQKEGIILCEINMENGLSCEKYSLALSEWNQVVWVKNLYDQIDTNHCAQ